MARGGNYTYNPQTGSWQQGSAAGSASAAKETPAPPKSGDNLTATDPSTGTGTGAVEKKYNNIEVNTLEGTLSYIANANTIKIKPGNTITLNNLGKFFSGKYYVKDVTRSISSNGYMHSATVIRTDVGNKLVMEAKEPEPTPVKKEPEKPKGRTYTVKKGDCLWNIAKQFYGNGASYGKIVDANTGKIVNPNLIYPGQVFEIP